jgi:GNAT superfamily N-acetyltransferase
MLPQLGPHGCQAREGDDNVRDSVTITPFGEPHAAQVRDLFVTVNRLLAPPQLRAVFESYVAQSLADEMDRVAAYYSEHGGGFWVALRTAKVVGMFGLERASPGALELRRMYVDPTARRGGIAALMLRFAEDECRRRGMQKIELSTSELQPAAIALYRQAGYRLLREAVAADASHKTIGGGVRRFYFEKSV